MGGLVHRRNKGAKLCKRLLAGLTSGYAFPVRLGSDRRSHCSSWQSDWRPHSLVFAPGWRIWLVAGVRKGICYFIFTDFVSNVTVHGPPATDTSSFAVEEVGETSTMLKRYFAGF